LLVGVLVQLPLNYGRDWLDADQWVDRDGTVYSGDGPFLNRPLRRLRRALRGWPSRRLVRAIRQRWFR